MRVLTLDNQKFVRHCKALEDKCICFEPDLIVGIANGGVRVAEKMFKTLPHCKILLQRPSTKVKNRRLFRYIAVLPAKVLDLMRMGESLLLQRFHPKKNVRVNLSQELKSTIAKAHNILIVDDAVDSGVTLKAIVNAVRQAAPDSLIKSAVITVTTKSPVIMPDFYIYNNRTLIRFPWSKDKK